MGVLTGWVYEVQLDYGDQLPVRPTKQVITARLSPTPLALPEKPHLALSYTGEIVDLSEGRRALDPAALRAPADTVQSWATDLGTLRLVRHFEYTGAWAGETDALLRIPWPTVVLEVHPNRLELEPAAQAKAFIGDMEPVLRLVSFLSRRRVHWLWLTVDSEIQIDGQRAPHEFVWERAGFRLEGEAGGRSREAFVNPYLFARGGGLSQMLTNLRASPYRDVLLSAMSHAIASLGGQYVEAALVNNLTALECLVNGVGRIDQTDRLLDAPMFERLRESLHGSLDEFARLNPSITETISTIKEDKLGGLNNRPLREKLVALAKRFPIEWSDLWTDAPDLGVAIRGVFRRRNKLIHAGAATSPRRIFIDSCRVHALVERLIYAMLGGDEEWLDSQAWTMTGSLPRLEQHAIEEGEQE
jgi:hypothetical protein